MTAARPLMFYELAGQYDGFVAAKDYRAESARLETLVHRYGRSAGDSWLDVACGTGRHLECLRRRHTVAGLDLSPAMLRIARDRLPGVPLYRADMRHFQLARTFDVVTCLFGAIGHVGTEMGVRRVFRNLGSHLRPGGVAIVEPWIRPEVFREGMIHLMTHEDRTTALVRLAYSVRRGQHSVIRSHYLVGKEGRGIRHLEQSDASGLLLSQPRLMQLMGQAGLRARWIPRGLRPGFPLLAGIRPLTRTHGRSDRSAHRPPVGN